MLGCQRQESGEPVVPVVCYSPLFLGKKTLKHTITNFLNSYFLLEVVAVCPGLNCVLPL